MKIDSALRRACSFLLVVGLAAGLLGSVPQPAAAAAKRPVDGAPGVIRVIVWDGVTKGFLNDLGSVASFDHVYTYETIRGAAVAVGARDAADVIAFAKARGLKAVRDSRVQADLTNSAKTAHVKPSGAGSPGAWALGYTGRGVTVGIIDTGLDDEHLSLNDLDDNPATTDPKVVQFRDWVGANGEANVEPYDDHDHGSHVGGIATGTGDGINGDGPLGNMHVGMAYEANLAGLKVLDSGGTGNATDIVAAINWAATNAGTVNPPIRVLNISIGQLLNTGDADGTSPQAQAVNAATAAGLVTAASAGNGDTDGLTPNVTAGNISSPGDAQTSIGVCSSNSAAPPAEPTFSDWDSEGPTVHNKPDVCGPGDSVMSVNANNGNPGAPSSGYVTFGGTSMASPHVAGIAALIIQAVPHITPAQVKEVIIETASHFAAGHSNDSGWGEVHAREAIELAIARYGGGPQPLLADIGGPYYVAQGELRPLAATATGGQPPYTFAWDLDDNGFFDNGTGPAATFTDTAALGVHTIRVRVTDGDGTVSTDTTTIEVLAPVSVFLDDVEGGPNGWAATSDGAATAAGWHEETFHSQSPTHAWYVGNDVAETYTNSENVSLTRSLDLSTGTAATSGQLLLKFAMSGTLEETFDFLRVEVGASELARYDDTTRNAWSTKSIDLTQYKGQTITLRFRFTSDDLVGPGEFTGPFVDDIRIMGTVAPSLDTTPPGVIGDLAAASPTRTTAQLTWTATGDDGAAGTATSYDLRRSTSPITDANFALSTLVPGTPNPKLAGGAESFTVTGLTADTTHYFAIRAQDEQTNLGPISNVTSITTLPPDVTPPSQVTNLAAAAGNSSVSLTWDAASDDDAVDHYVIYRDGVAAAQTSSLAASIAGLNNGQTYSFEVSAVDRSDNEGLRSTPVLATPVEPPAVAGWTQFHGNAARTGTGAPRAGIPTPKLIQELSPGGSVTSSPLIADLDGDGKLDVVSVSDVTQAGGRITVKAFKQGATGLDPNPMWTHEVPVGVLGGNPTNGIGSIAIGDLDQDGDAEVVVYTNYLLNLGAATSNNGRLSVLNGQTGAAIGAIAGVPDLPIGLPSTPAIGDVSGDGVPEIVITRQTGGADATTGYYVMSANLVNGAVVKGFDTRLGTVALFASPALAELRSAHDGLEVVVAEGSGSNTAGRLYVCKPDGGAAVCNESIATTTGLRGVAVADLDGDGIPEIVANGRTGQSLNVVRTAAPLSLVSRADSFLWNTPSLGDVDGDGRADIVNINYSEFADDVPKQGDVRLRGFQGGAITDKGTLSRPPAPGTSTQAQGGGALIDLVGGTGPEFVFGSGDSKLVAAKFSSPPTALWSLDLSGNPISPVAAGDVNGDGRADLVVGTSNGKVIVVGNAPPTLAAIGPKTVAEAANLSFAISGADPDGDTLTYSAPTLPPGATFDSATRTFSWTPGFDDAGTHTARFEVSDGGGSAGEDVTITVTNVPRAPEITLPAQGTVVGDATPDISGTSEGVSVEVLVDGTSVGSVPVVSGAWTITAPLLADGAHAAAAQATDGLGTLSAPSSPRDFSVDTTAPTAPVITAPLEGALLSDTAPTISGDAEAGASVEVSVDGVPVGTVTATGGAWSYTLTAAQSLADGSHATTATATDGVGNVSAPSAPRAFTIDTGAPAPPIVITPADGSTIADSTPDVSGSAEPGSEVEVFVDGTSTGSVTASGGAWSLTSSALGDGSHAATATATDGAGNVSALSAPTSFTIDTTGPAATVITAPLEGTTLSDTTPTISGDAEADASVEVSVDGVPVGTVTATGGAWSYTVTAAQALADGTHTARAVATDTVGNVGAPSEIRSFTIDTTAPTAPVITTPLEGALLSDTTPTISGDAEADASVEVSVDGVPVGTVTATGGAWSYTLTAAQSLADGSHAATATATDGVGNVSAPSAPLNFTIDTVAPSAPSISAPLDGAALADSTPDMSGTAENGASVEVFVDGASIGTATATGGSWSVTSSTLTDGAHAATAQATDAAGNASLVSAPRSFTVDTTGPAAPEIATPTEGAVLATREPTIAGEAETGSTVEVLVDGVVVGTVTANSPWTYTLTAAQALADGVHNVRARATDALGNAGALSAARSFRIDATAPAAPAFTVPAEGAVLNDSTPELRGTAETGSTVDLFVNGLIVGSVGAPGGTWSYTLGAAQALPDGTHAATARARDAAGNTGPLSAPRTFTVDVSAPAAPAIAFDDPEITQAESFATTLSGTREAGSSLRITISDQVDTTPDVVLNLPAGPAAFSATADLRGMALGRLEARAVATDSFGRVSPAGLALARKVPDAPGPVPPRVIIRDGDGLVTPVGDNPAAVAIDVTHLGPSASADVTLAVTDGVDTLTIPMGTMSLDVPATATVDLTSLRDGQITATATADAAAGSDTTMLDRRSPESNFSAATTPYCIVIPVIGFTTCRLEGTATDATSGVNLVYVTGVNESQGGTYARHATLTSPGATTTTFSLSGARLATLSPGTWTFRARGEDIGGNFEEIGGTATILVL